MVRSPCCDKTKVKKGPWSRAEDSRLTSYIQQFGHSNWRALPQQAGLLRCGKSCRLRWINYLRPDVKRGNLSPEEEETIIRLHKTMGNSWSRIASQLPGRTDNEIKNVWNTYLKKKAHRIDDAATRHQDKSKDSSTSYSSSPSPSSGSCISYGDPNNLDKGPASQEAQESLAGVTDYLKQDGQFSAASMQAQCNPIDEPKEELVSPGPCNITSNVQCLVSRPMEETTPLLHSTNGTSEVQNLMPTEAKQGMVSDENVGIPFDSDFEFWSMFDSLVHTEPIEFQPQEPEASKPESRNSGGDAEYKKWLKYLENELGLAGGTDSDCLQHAAAEELGMTAEDNELMFSSEIYPGTSFFSTWPSPTQDFGF